MEDFEIIISAVIIIVGCVLCHKFATGYDEYIEDKYCKGCITWWWSVLTAVLLTATLFTDGGDIFWLFFLLTLGSAGLSGWVTYREMIGWGATSKEARIGGLAQIASAIGIAAAIIFILLLLFGGSSKKRRRR